MNIKKALEYSKENGKDNSTILNYCDFKWHALPQCSRRKAKEKDLNKGGKKQENSNTIAQSALLGGLDSTKTSTIYFPRYNLQYVS